MSTLNINLNNVQPLDTILTGLSGLAYSGNQGLFIKVNATADGFEFAAGGGSSTFADNMFQVYDNADNTKILAFEASGITTGTTRTLTIPNASGTIALTSDLSSYVPYTGASGNVDLGSHLLNAKSFHIKGTAGNGHLGLKHQSAGATAGGSESVIYADNNGDPKWKNDGNAVQNVMLENAAITGATKTKITYDAKGLVTSGADATTADIADSSNKRYVTDAQLVVVGNTSGTNTGDQTLIGLGGVAANTAITGATKTKITYDSKGLVTSGADATTADIAASTNKNYVTDAQLTVIGNTSGTNSGNQTLANTSDATSHTVTLSATGGSVQLVEGSGITLTTTGTSADGIITIASTGGGGGSTFADNVFEIYDNTDNTKKLAFEASGITTGTTRTLTIPNANGTIALTSDLASYVPYTGATTSVNLGANNLTATAGTFSGAFAVGTDAIYRVAGSSKVSFGTTVQNYQFTLYATGNDNRLHFLNNTTGTAITDGTFMGLDDGVNFSFWQRENGYIRFGTNENERLRITGAGLVAIGNTAPSAILHANSSGGATDLFRVDLAGVRRFRITSGGTVTLISNNTGFYEGASTGFDFSNTSAPAATQSAYNFYGRQSTNSTGESTHFDMGGKNIAATTGFARASGTGTWIGARLDYTINNTGTYSGTVTGFYLNATETSITGTTHNLLNLLIGGSSRFRVGNSGKITFDSTITAGGTTGNQTINKPSGTVNIAAAGTTVTVTNSLVTTSSIVMAVVRTNDTTAYIKNVVPSAGSFVITLGAAATAETSIGFIVNN